MAGKNPNVATLFIVIYRFHRKGKDNLIAHFKLIVISCSSYINFMKNEIKKKIINNQKFLCYL